MSFQLNTNPPSTISIDRLTFDLTKDNLSLFANGKESITGIPTPTRLKANVTEIESVLVLANEEAGTSLTSEQLRNLLLALAHYGVRQDRQSKQEKQDRQSKQENE